MAAHAVLVLCAQAILAYVVFGYCVNPGAEHFRTLPAPYAGARPCGACGGSGLNYGAALGCGSPQANGYAGAGLSAASFDVIPSSGGALPTSSSTSISPNGLSVASENVFEGAVQVVGELPFLSAVALEGVLASGGAGIVNYSCGNGITAITNAGSAAGAGIGSAGIGAGAYGYGSGISAIAPGACPGYVGLRGCGCGGYY